MPRDPGDFVDSPLNLHTVHIQKTEMHEMLKSKNSFDSDYFVS
jgi:hypothetical protein